LVRPDDLFVIGFRSRALRMRGAGAPDDLDACAATQVWLATSNDPEAMVS